MSVEAVINRIAGDFEALTPPDRPSVPYARLRSRLPEDYARQFSFAPPRRDQVESQNSTGLRVLWTIPILVAIDATGRSFEERSVAAAREARLLCAAIDKRTVWPAGVWWVAVESSDLDISEDSGDISLTIFVRALIGEDY